MWALRIDPHQQLIESGQYREPRQTSRWARDAADVGTPSGFRRQRRGSRKAVQRRAPRAGRASASSRPAPRSARLPGAARPERAQPQLSPKGQHTKLGPNRARQVRACLSLVRQKSKYAFSFRHFHRLQQAGKSACGKDHTVLPYARPAISQQFFQPCRRSRKLTDETNLTAPLIQHEALGSRRAIRPALNLSHPTLSRPPQPGPRQ
ncbi:hypothetical protein ABIB81_008343 [Bradyrhizobium sp. I1.7.5]